MGKNKTKAAPSAAEAAAAKQAAPQTEAPKQEPAKVDVVPLGDLAKLGTKTTGTLDENHTAEILTGMRKMFFDNKNAAEDFNVSPETVQKVNQITAAGHIALFATAIVMDNTPFAEKMRAAQLQEIIEVAPKFGITINQALLPPPTKEGVVELTTAAVEVSEETKEAIKKEQTAVKGDIQLDPTKIENEDQLKKSLLQILVKGNGSTNLYDKIVTAINFYEAFLGIQAGKSEDPEAARAALKEASRADLLFEISTLLGKCTFSISGIAKLMYESTERTKSPVVAFCTLRDASLNKTTGAPQIDDQLVADIVKVLIKWFGSSEVEETKRIIGNMEKDLEVLKKDAKKNAKGIAEGQKKIENAKKHIEDVERVINYAYVPGREVIDSFPEDYKDNSREGFKMARMIGSKIAKTYYGKVAMKAVEMESLIYNLQQYMGVITNMFTPALQNFTDFSEANITELEMKKAEEPAEEKNE